MFGPSVVDARLPAVPRPSPRSIILVVEDDAEVQGLLRHLLEAEGYGVQTAVDGRAGLAMIHAGHVDLVLLDVMLPDVHGFELCQQVRSRTDLTYLPIIMLTALSDAAERHAGFAAGADDYVTKPFRTDDLLDRVRVWLQARERLRVANERLLQQSQEQSRMILETASDAYIAIDDRSVIIDWNRQATSTFGWSREEIIGQSLVDTLIPDRYRAAHRHGLQQLLATGEGSVLYKRVELTALHREGHELPVELTIWPLAAGRSYTFSAIVRDLSAQRQAETALRQSEDRLRQSQKMEAIGQLAGGVAHDFNNLLTVINGFSEMLLAVVQPPGQRGFVEEIRKAGEHAAALTHQLMAFSRQQMLVPEVVELNSIVVDMEKMLRRLIGEDVELVTVPRPGAGRVTVDPGQIQQVLLNLALNARDAMPEGGRLTIETAEAELDEAYARAHGDIPAGRYVMLAVSDTGTGMDADVLSHIFEPFFTTKEVDKGTGLGLATVYGIVKQSAGDIWVYSEPGQGTTFKIYLPRVQNQAADVAPASPSLATLTGTETVLLVEDETQVRALARLVLEEAGYTVIEARRGDEAIQVGEQHPGPIQLLLTDVVMPGLGGRAVAEHLGRTRPNLRVLYMSGYTDNAIDQHGVLGPGVTLLQKPFTLHALARKVREVLDAPLSPHASTSHPAAEAPIEHV